MKQSTMYTTIYKKKKKKTKNLTNYSFFEQTVVNTPLLNNYSLPRHHVRETRKQIITTLDSRILDTTLVRL